MLEFWHMNGLGNQFVVLDARKRRVALSEEQVRQIADPTTGPGCDQLIMLEPSSDADVFMRIWNADGSEVDACGNATRAVGWKIMDDTGRPDVAIATNAGLLHAWACAEPMTAMVDMGEPGLHWTQIPLSEPMETIRMELQVGPLDDPVLWGPSAVSMGNPHCVFFVDDVDAAPVREVGPMIEYHPLFPERANIGFAQVVDRGRIKLRVWERGVGETQACGTGACAALVAAVRRKLVDRMAVVELTGGPLAVEWRESDGHVLMVGAVELNAVGEIDL
jgi:diaminopimelate epimerase